MDISNQNMEILQTMLQSVQQIDSTMKTAVNQANGDNGNPLGVSFEFSKPSELMSQLSQLQSADPEKFKSLMSDISEKLETAAAESEAGSFDATMLSELAAKFSSVAESGDLSELQPQPPQGPPPAGGAGGGGGAKSGGAEGAGGGGGASSTSNSTCSTCGATVEAGAATCPSCGAVQDITSSLESAMDSSKIAQYLISGADDEKESIMGVLTTLLEENESGVNSSGASGKAISSIRDMIEKAIEEMTNTIEENA